MPKYTAEPGTSVGYSDDEGNTKRTLVFDDKGQLEVADSNAAAIRALEGSIAAGLVKETKAEKGKES